MIENIAIISDTHNNFTAGEKVKEILKKEGISFIIHCGDIGEPGFLKKIFKGFKVRAVLGNMDEGYGEIEDYQGTDIIVYKEFGEEGKMAFTHFPEKARELAKTGKYKMVFYGHTHKPWEEKIGDCILLNPGNVTGTFYRPSFAILKDDRFELRILQ